MALLKRKSKGSGVKDLQGQLNKNGAKPTLKTDSIFGPLTDKAVREWQKKCGLKTDGKAGDYTLAALKFGGKLPEMTVSDFTKFNDYFKTAKKYNRSVVIQFELIGEAMAKTVEVWAKEMPKARKASDMNQKNWERGIALSGKVVSKQSEYEKVLIKDPARAKKLVAECEDLKKQVYEIRDGDFKKLSKEVSAGINKVKVKFKIVTDAIETAEAEISKNNN